MGLDFSHGGARWSYSGFHNFRRQLAKEIGIDLDQMQGFDMSGGKNPNYLAISWDTVDDPIVLLLNHSDCEDDLSPAECALVAPRLRELVANWDVSDWEYNYDKENALLLAEGMEECARLGIPLEFR